MGLNCSKTMDSDNFQIDLNNPFPLMRNSTSNCNYEEPGVEIVYKFYLVAVFGTGLAVISFVENTPLFYIFLHRRHFRQSHYFYMMFLAFFDIFIAISYIMLFTVQVLFDYLESPELSATWHFYLSPIFTVSKVSLTAATYLVVAATVERFLVTNRLISYAFGQEHRSLAVVFSIFAAMVFNGMVYFEVTVIEKPNCTNMARYAASPTSLMQNDGYKAIFAFWIRNVFTIILPFLLLAYMNVSIVLRMITEQKNAKEFEKRTSSVICRKRFGSGIGEGQKNVQLATRMLVLIVTGYLISNVPSVILTTWEFVGFDQLHDINDGNFYNFAADIVSILTVVCGALRLPIYVYCNKKVSTELKNLLMMRFYSSETGFSLTPSVTVRRASAYSTTNRANNENSNKFEEVGLKSNLSVKRQYRECRSASSIFRSCSESGHLIVCDISASDGGTAL